MNIRCDLVTDGTLLISGSWFTFTGNHIGVLLASHIFDSIETKDHDNPRIAILNSTVSTGMLEKMALSKGFHFQEALTGFKWMANVTQDLEKEGFTVPFAFEEALGYMFPSVCYDKDGIAAALVFLLAISKWDNKSAYGKLQQLFREFGHHETLNNYFRSPNPQTTMTLFEKIRESRNNTNVSGNFGSFKILRWRDMTLGYDSGTIDNKPTLPVDSGSQMLTVWLDREVRLTFRASGTEPKVKCKPFPSPSLSFFHDSHPQVLTNLYVIKVYIESCCPSRDEAVSAVCDAFSTVLNVWVRPFAPSMTHNKRMSTSSGNVFILE